MRYRFVFDDSESGSFSDDREFETPGVAREEAIRELSFLMSSRLPDGDHRRFTVAVFDEAGGAVYSASLSFEGQRLRAEDLARATGERA